MPRPTCPRLHRPRCLVESLEPRLLLSSADPYCSFPGVIIDVRLPDGSKTISGICVGQIIRLEVFAAVIGANDSPDDEALQSICGSFLSTNIGGGAALGNLSARPCFPFSAVGSTNGAAADLDNDGDLDVGARDGTPSDLAARFFSARAGSMESETGTSVGNARTFKIATLTFRVTQLLPGLQTQINFRPRPCANAALWMVDTSCDLGDASRTPVRTTRPVVLTALPSVPDDALTANQPPVFLTGPVLTCVEESGRQTIPGWATRILPGPARESSQSLTFLLLADDPSLFSEQPAISPDGTLTYTPAPNATGQAHVVVILKDDGGTDNGGVDTSSPGTLEICIFGVNDPPSFTVGADQTVNKNAPFQRIPNWAVNLSCGPSNEQRQTLSFIVSTDNPSLFSSRPGVNSAGTLEYAPAPRVTGQATITVILKDGGGTSFGGSDASPSQSFTITILPTNTPTAFVSFSSTPITQGLDFQLTATGVTDLDGPISQARFYYDFNNDGQLNPDTDLLLGPGINSVDNAWSLQASSQNLPLGPATFFFAAYDGEQWTTPDPITINVSAPQPPAPVDPPPDPAPVNPAPVDPVPVDPVPIDPVPVDPTPVYPVLVDPVYFDPTPVNPISIDPTGVNPIPADPTPTMIAFDPAPTPSNGRFQLSVSAIERVFLNGDAVNVASTLALTDSCSPVISDSVAAPPITIAGESSLFGISLAVPGAHAQTVLSIPQSPLHPASQLAAPPPIPWTFNLGNPISSILSPDSSLLTPRQDLL